MLSLKWSINSPAQKKQKNWQLFQEKETIKDSNAQILDWEDRWIKRVGEEEFYDTKSDLLWDRHHLLATHNAALRDPEDSTTHRQWLDSSDSES